MGRAPEGGVEKDEELEPGSAKAESASVAPVRQLAVLGGGTMGAGIAQLALGCGLEVVVVETDAPARESLSQRISAGLARGGARGDDRGPKRLRVTADVAEAASAEVVVEAVTEELALKRRVLSEVASSVSTNALIATNTSSLSVTQLAAGLPAPERVIGLHFFNPAPVMALVEVVAGAASGDEALARGQAFARQLGRTPVLAQDQPGFIVNRCARPFYLEPLRLLGDGHADVATLDRLIRDGLGYRMGPFELMDLIGLDVSLAVSRTIYDAFFQEPRFRPHRLQQQWVDGAWLGRKSGRGWYRYQEGSNRGHLPFIPPTVDPAARDGLNSTPPTGPGYVVVCGGGLYADSLAHRATDRGWDIATWRKPDERPVPVGVDRALVAVEGGLEAGPRKREWLELLHRTLPREAPILSLALGAAPSSIAALAPDPSRVVGFATLPQLPENIWVELADLPAAREATRAAAGALRGLGYQVQTVGDSPGLVRHRVLASLANEAAFALTEGLASARDIDDAMRLGANHPRGPCAWGDLLGLEVVVAVLHALAAEHARAQYRVAPVLRGLINAAGGRTPVRGLAPHIRSKPQRLPGGRIAAEEYNPEAR